MRCMHMIYLFGDGECSVMMHRWYVYWIRHLSDTSICLFL